MIAQLWNLRYTIVTGMLLGIVAAPGVGLGALWARSWEAQRHPVITGWVVQKVTLEGPDIIIAGIMAKVRDCDYLPPPHARDEQGQNYEVISTSPTRASSWDAAGTPQRFGPWRVKGGAGHRLTFYLEHRCHPMWRQITELGTLQTADQGTP